MGTGTRERILDALRHVLASGGASAVTLESVAAQAGLSKGGLLYHFKTKQSLYDGLLDAALVEVTAAMAERTARLSPAHAYLDYALPESEEEAAYTAALIAAVRADDAVGPDAAERLAETFRRWDAPLLAGVADPILAETIRLVGHGLYLGAVAGLPAPPPEVLRQVMDRLVTSADTPEDP